MTPDEFSELVAAKRKEWQKLMNPQGVPYFELPPPPEPEALETGEQGQLW